MDPGATRGHLSFYSVYNRLQSWSRHGILKEIEVHLNLSMWAARNLAMSGSSKGHA